MFGTNATIRIKKSIMRVKMKEGKIKDKKKADAVFMPYIKKRKYGVFFYILLQFLASFIYVGITLLFAQFLNELTQSNFNKAIMLLILAFVMNLSNRAIYAYVTFLYIKLSNKMSAELKKDLIQRTFMLTSSSMGNIPTGKLTNRVCKDPENIFSSLDTALDNLTSMTTGFITLVIIALFNVYIAIIFFIAISLLSLIEYKKLQWFKKAGKIRDLKHDKIYSLVGEISKSERDIKVLNLEENLKKVANERVDDYQSESTKVRNKSTAFFTFREYGIILTAFAICLTSLFLLKDKGISLAAFLFIYSNQDSIGYFVRQVGGISQVCGEVKVASARLKTLYKEENLPIEHFGNENLDNFSGKVEFNNVGFKYESFSKEIDEEIIEKKRRKPKKQANDEIKVEELSKKINEGVEVLKDISFIINSNEVVAFVGKSGGGKTTILNLITKIYDANRGQVLLDGKDIQNLSKEAIRKNISLVNQFPYIFDATIKENLLLIKPEATEEELIEVCKKAALWDFIESLPNKLNTVVGEGGIKLSGGQRQRLAIARVFLKDSKLILFDESTSSLDNLAQEEIKESIKMLSNQRTVIIVAHRLSTIKNADRIFFIADGKIEDSGKFNVLIDRCEKFQELFNVETI